MNQRIEALRYFETSDAEYVFFLNSSVILNNYNTLKILVTQNQHVIAPMIRVNVFRPTHKQIVAQSGYHENITFYIKFYTTIRRYYVSNLNFFVVLMFIKWSLDNLIIYHDFILVISRFYLDRYYGKGLKSIAFDFWTLTVVEWKDYHFLAVVTVSDLQDSYWNQWPHPYEPQISNTFAFLAICLHFIAILAKFAKKKVLKKPCAYDTTYTNSEFQLFLFLFKLRPLILK